MLTTTAVLMITFTEVNKKYKHLQEEFSEP